MSAEHRRDPDSEENQRMTRENEAAVRAAEAQVALFSAYFLREGNWWLYSFGILKENASGVLAEILECQKCDGVKIEPMNDKLRKMMSNAL